MPTIDTLYSMLRLQPRFEGDGLQPVRKLTYKQWGFSLGGKGRWSKMTNVITLC